MLIFFSFFLFFICIYIYIYMYNHCFNIIILPSLAAELLGHIRALLLRFAVFIEESGRLNPHDGSALLFAAVFPGFLVRVEDGVLQSGWRRIE